VAASLRSAAAAALGEGDAAAALALLERAVAEPPPSAERAATLHEAGAAAIACGELRVAVERLREARSREAGPLAGALTSLDLGRALYLSGRPGEAAAVLDSARGELEAAGDGGGELATALRAAWLTTARIDSRQRAAAARFSRDIAQRAPAPRSYADRALLAQVAGHLTFDAEPRDRVLSLARLALGDGDLVAQETADGMTWPVLAGVLGWSGELDECESLCRLALDDAARRESGSGLATASFALAVVLHFRGMLAESLEGSGRALDGRGGQFLVAARALHAMTLIECDRLDAAQAQLDAAPRDPGWETSTMQALVFESQARVHLARGRCREALDAALEAGRLCRRFEMSNPSVCAWRSRAAVAAARLGDVERAEGLLEEGLDLARRFGAPRPIGIVLTAAGHVRSGRAQLDALEEACGVLADSPARLEHARAVVAHGAALRRQGRRRSAREVLHTGLDLCSALGATALERRAGSELAAAGGRPRRRRVGGLTPAELRVARAAADGMSNREIAGSLFVSLRTVETHLTHTYSKLGISSRAALPEALERVAGAASAS
jgi:DNA-binding CsgD family transcriptional regulator